MECVVGGPNSGPGGWAFRAVRAVLYYASQVGGVRSAGDVVRCVRDPRDSGGRCGGLA